MESTKFSPEQSLRVINQHLQKSRKNLAGNSFYYLIWGYLSIAAAISHYILLKTQITPYAFLPWPILKSGGALIVAFYKPKSRKDIKGTIRIRCATCKLKVEKPLKIMWKI